MNQSMDFFWIFISNIPGMFIIAVYIAILVFAIFIYSRNSYRYGFFLIITSVALIASAILSYFNDYFAGTLLSMVIYGYTSYGLHLVAFIFLFLSVYYIYRTHNKNKIK